MKYYALEMVLNERKQRQWSSLDLPLGVRLLLELLKNGNDVLQSFHLAGQLLLDLRLDLVGDRGAGGQGLVEALVVRGSTHGQVKDRLYSPTMVLTEGNAVGSTEGVSELLGGVVDVAAEGLGCEVKTPILFRRG